MAVRDCVPAVPVQALSMGASVVLLDIVRLPSDPSPKYPDTPYRSSLYDLLFVDSSHLPNRVIELPMAGRVVALK